MPNWFDGYVTANNLKIHYYRTGGDKPQVVMSHGAGDDGLCWTRVVKELEQDYDVIMPDARGHGKSGSGKKDYSTRQRAADLLGLIQALKLEKPVIGGHSMGADTSMHLAAECPGLASGVFIEDPPIVLPGEKFGAGGRKVDIETAGEMLRRLMLAFKLLPRCIGVRLARKVSPTSPDDEINPWVDSKRMLGFDFLNCMNLTDFMDLSDPFRVFEQVNVPVLFFIGDKEKMSIVSREAAQAAARANPRVQLVHLEGASHEIHRTRFDGYVPALKKFLSEIYSS